MNQQIFLEIGQQHSNINSNSNQIKIGQDHDFELLQDNQQQIVQDIIENYEQDFDQESHHSQHQQYHSQKYIQQDFPQEQISQAEDSDANESSKQKLDKQACDIQEQCIKLQQQIKKLQQKINLHQLIIPNQQESQQGIQKIIQTIEDNNQYLLSLEQQKNIFFQTKLGRQSFSINHINTPEELDEKLLEQIQKCKMSVNLSFVEIGKLKREIKKNEDYLPNQEIVKQEFYQRYKRIKKEIDQKKEKYEQNQIKGQTLDDKLDTIKQKITKIDQSKLHEAESQKIIKEQLEKRFMILQKKKQTQTKKNNLISHQFTSSLQSLSREISDLKKQIYANNEKISSIFEKNEKIEKQSEKLMKIYDSIQGNFKISPLKMSQKVAAIQVPVQVAAISQRMLQRGKIRSQPKNSFAKNIQNPKFNDQNLLNALKKMQQDTKALPIILGNASSHRITQIEQVETPLKRDIAQNLGSNNIRAFKLKLPSYQTQRSNKNLNSSLDIRVSTIRPKNKTDFSKLSITQRLQRIQNLQKEDRIQSYKLYESRSKQQKNNQSMNENISQQQGMRKQSFSVQQFSSYNKQISRFANRFLKDTPKIQRKSTTMKPDDSISASQIIKNDENLFQPQQNHGEILENSTQLSVSNNTNPRQSKYLKKRIASRQKKISQDYMRILEQKGRKILQLDSESEV